MQKSTTEIWEIKNFYCLDSSGTYTYVYICQNTLNHAYFFLN